MPWRFTPTGKPCRHCGHSHAPRPRGLCCRCSLNQAIRRQYPSTHRCARRGVGVDYNGGYELPEAACGELPGSEGKVLEMMRRARAGVALWHPADGKRETV